MTKGNSILSSYGTTIFTVMSGLAAEHDAINLGQGFPDRDGPLDIARVAADFLVDGFNQYPPMMGIPELRQAVAAHNKRFYDLDIDWKSEVMVTSGATEALGDCILGLVEPGDEVILIEPLFDSYLPMVQRAGGIPKFVRLEPPNWELPKQALEEAFSDKTKFILLNSPHNPSGKVFNREELEFIAALLEKFDALAVCDEVYEHITCTGHPHIPLMTLPHMRNRCLRIGSAGKTFSMTGWKVGYITGCPDLIGAIAKAHQFVTFTTPPNLQHGVAYGLGKEDDYFQNLSKGMEANRDLLSKGLEGAGFKVLETQGTYFLTVDFSPLGFDGDDVEFCRHITTEAGVSAVPMSAFYTHDGPDHFARFCFCKQPEILKEAIDRLKAHFSS